LANEAGAPQVPVIVCDAVRSMGVHNGVARITFIRLLPDGRPLPSLELLLPTATVAQIVKTLQTVKV
jgi:hypothetical protein